MTKAEQMIQEYKASQKKYEPKYAAKKDYTVYYVCGAIAAVITVGLGIFLWNSKGVA